MADSEVQIVHGPLWEHRAEVATLGIRENVPFRTMLSHRDRLLAELELWLREHAVDPEGPFFLRLHVVDMAGLMDIEVGVAATAPHPDARVRAGEIPAGDYAVLSYRRTSLAANRLLLGWVAESGRTLDSRATADGEAFAARLETYLTDPRTETRKKEWVVELAFMASPDVPQPEPAGAAP